MFDISSLINLSSQTGSTAGAEAGKTSSGGEAPSFMAYLSAMMEHSKNSGVADISTDGKNILSSKKISTLSAGSIEQENNSQSDSPWAAIAGQKPADGVNAFAMGIDSEKIKGLLSSGESKAELARLITLLDGAETAGEKEELLEKMQNIASLAEAVKAEVAKAYGEDADRLAAVLAKGIKPKTQDKDDTGGINTAENKSGGAGAVTVTASGSIPSNIPTAEAYMAHFEEMLRAAKDVLAWIGTDGYMTDNIGHAVEDGLSSMAEQEAEALLSSLNSLENHAESAVFADNTKLTAVMPGKDAGQSTMAMAAHVDAKAVTPVTSGKDEPSHAEKHDDASYGMKSGVFADDEVVTSASADTNKGVKAEKPAVSEEKSVRYDVEAKKQDVLKVDEMKLVKANEAADKDVVKAETIKTEPVKNETAQKIENPVKTEVTESKAPAEQTRQAAQVKNPAVQEQAAKNTEPSKTVDAAKQESVKPAQESVFADSGEDNSENKEENKSENKFASILNNAKSSTDKAPQQMNTQKSATEQTVHQMPTERAETRTVNVEQPQQRTAAPEERVLQWQSVRDAANLARMVQQAQQNGETKLTVRLNPEHLGRLEIQLTEVNGRIDAKILANSHESRNLLASAGDAIRQQLLDKGIHIDNMDFNFHDTLAKQGQGGQDQENRETSQRRQHVKDGKDGDSAEEHESKNTKPDRGLYA